MKELLNEIEKGFEKITNESYSSIGFVKGFGSKAYVNKRIDLLREQLLDMKKELWRY